MTDIKELMQTLRAAANNASSGEWVKESGDGWEASYSADDQSNGGFIIAQFEGPDAAANREFVQAASPENIKLLIEALEAKDARIAELQESHAQVIHSRDHYKRVSGFLASRSVELQSRAEAAESRAVTVTLPERYDIEMWPSPAPDGEWYSRNDILESLAAAGIQIQGGEL